MNFEQNMWSCDLPASPDKFDLLHWYHCWYTVNNPWQTENCIYYIHTLKEIDNSGITVTLDSKSNSQDCFGVPFIHEFVWSKISSKLWQSTIIAFLTLPGEGIVDNAGDICAPQGGAFEWDFGLERPKVCPTQSSQLQLKC